MSFTADNEKIAKRRAAKEERMENLRQRYWQATTEELPALAASRIWPVEEGHCFQRIVLDTICKGVWYDKIPEPAIARMTEAQLRKATYLAEDLVRGMTALEPLNEQSIQWRRARQRRWA
jgi:hypothetical protein